MFRRPKDRPCDREGHSTSLTRDGQITCLRCHTTWNPRSPLELAAVGLQDFGRLIADLGRRAA